MHRFGLTLLALWIFCVAATGFLARGVAAIAVGPIVEATRSIARWAPQPPASGGEFVVTVLDPPYFGVDGSAVGSAPPLDGVAEPQQVSPEYLN